MPRFSFEKHRYTVITALVVLGALHALAAQPVGFATSGKLVSATDGSNLVSLNASSLSSGSVPAARLTGQAAMGASFSAAATDTIGANATRYMNGVGLTSGSGQNLLFSLPSAMNVVGLACYVNQGTGTSTMTVQKFDHMAWSDIAATCSATSLQAYCTWTGSVAISATYTLAIKIATSAGNSANLYSCSVTLAP